jgi:pseudouridine-5'-phosphate glycosidase
LLDLPKTVEALETAGVPILGYLTGEFPAFYRRESGLAIDQHCDSVDQLATAVATHFELDHRPTGVLVANPIPTEHEMPERDYEEALERAFESLASSSVTGRGVTPFLLEQLDRFSAGRSVSANRALLENNAALAARLAQAMA